MRKGAESSPYGSQPYQLSLAIGINHVSKIERQFDSISSIEPAFAN